MELSELYSSKILEIAGRLKKIAPLDDFDISAKKHSKICGSKIELFLKLQNGIVTAYSHDISLDALGQTSASIVSEQIIGSSEEELRNLYIKMVSMLKEDGKPPSGKWSDLQYLQPVKSYPSRHTSTLLVFAAIVECFDKLQSKNNE